MPAKLSTTVNKIQSVPNLANREAITAFHVYLMINDLSVHHVNNNLKAVISFENYVSSETSFHGTASRQTVISFLDRKRKYVDNDPEMRWITTWNHYYLNRLRLFFRWFHNRYVRGIGESVGEPDWETPGIVRIKSRKSKRVSPYSSG
jgi:integrase/recombinase XerD